MVKTKKRRIRSEELDSAYFLKLVMYLIIGSFWLHISTASGSAAVPLPIGLAVGLLFAWHEQFQIDRKIEYAVLLIAMVVGFWAQIGVFVRL